MEKTLQAEEQQLNDQFNQAQDALEDIKQNQDQEESKTTQKVKYYQWDEEMTDQANSILLQETNQMTQEMYAKLEKDAKRNWDIFYKNNKTNFYKDRHYIKFEFSELSDRIQSIPEEDKTTKYRLLDVGCGVGNGFYPLYREFQGRLLINCCDFSPRAVNFVKEHELYKADEINAHVVDLVNDEIPFEKETADFGIMLFVLSAISPENFKSVAQKIYDQMKDDGILYFRDYGKYDLAQLRLAQRGNQKLKDNFYIRSDKTRAYYFTTDEVKEIFENAGFTQVENQYHYRLIENRKDQKKMHRVWIQAKFQRISKLDNQSEDNKQIEQYDKF
ncbi:actin-binding protein [Stylonychia lemnae]|uniref:tRNA N(3)-methylcytidine methyltransferase n=1 Tax=Stylonychia lemnae TaxID=5949 RepID=A0A078AEJ9_STYLE|nr:actin-binding protein [Stylonychia lemnae]|eukprot:CDW80271.1 actin-binding protein [Stylonychia lemnae]